jgi:serine/threonine-protein kinase
MARIFVAEDEQLQRRVALKILPPEDADEEGRARFLREARALARVQHKNVVQVFASGTDGDLAWMALELVEGESVGALGVLDEESALSLCAQAARGLAAAHATGVVHRDVKPDNLLLDAHGVVRVVDFGVALFLQMRLEVGLERGGGGRGGFQTKPGIAVGTPHFMAPEQARGLSVDARTDAWGLGATLYMLLVGQPPFHRQADEPDLDILARVIRERAPDVRLARADVSAATAEVLARMLEADVDKRLADMEVIAARLDAIADGLASGEAHDRGGLPADPAPPTPGRSAVDAGVDPGPPSKGRSGIRRAARVVVATVMGLVLALAIVAFVAPLIPYEPPASTSPSPASPPGSPSARPIEPPEPRATTAPGDALAVRSEGDDLPPEPLSAAALAAQAERDPERGVVDLLSSDAPVATEALALLILGDGVGSERAARAVAAGAGARHVELLGRLALDRRPERARLAIGAFERLKTDASLPLLDRVAAEHPDAKVRAEALRVRRSLFRVEP